MTLNIKCRRHLHLNDIDATMQSPNWNCPHNWNETETNRTPKQPWNVLTVLANHSRYPLFMAWRANSGHSLRLAKTTETFHCCFVSAEIKLFYFRFISTVWTAQRAGKPGGLRLLRVCRLSP